MRQRISSQRTPVVLLVAIWATCGAADAQTIGADSYHFGGYDAQSEIRRLRERLDAYDRDLSDMRRAMRQTIQRLPGTRDNYIEANWNSSLFDAKDGEPIEVPIIEKPTHKVGGRIFFDHMMAAQDAVNRGAAGGPGELMNRTHFDTVRLFVAGNIYENVDYKLQVAFGEQADVRMKDIYMGVHLLPYVGNVKIGHFKEPFGLDQLISSRFITFMERNLSDMFSPARNAGFMAYNDVCDNPNLSWYAGLFRSEIDDDPVDEQEDSGDWSATGRTVWLPIYDEPSGGRYLVHLGAAASHRRYGDGGVTYSQDVGLGIAGTFLAQALAVDEVNLLGIEAAAVWGSLHLQGEYTHVDAQLTAGGAADLDAGYVQVGYFLTGEHRGYKRSANVFDRTKVIEPFFRVRTAEGICRGKGAWEIAYRWAMADLDDGALSSGGTYSNHTIGLNWYLNDYTRIMFNYVRGDQYITPSGAAGGQVDAFGMRFQVDF